MIETIASKNVILWPSWVNIKARNPLFLAVLVYFLTAVPGYAQRHLAVSSVTGFNPEAVVDTAIDNQIVSPTENIHPFTAQNFSKAPVNFETHANSSWAILGLTREIGHTVFLPYDVKDGINIGFDSRSLPAVFPDSSEENLTTLGIVLKKKVIEYYPRTKLVVTDLSGVSSYVLSDLEGAPAGLKGRPEQPDSSQREYGHRPLSDCVFGDNERCVKPVPKAYPWMALGIFLVLGWGVARLIRLMGAPEE